jgi:hypothetical protein
MGLCLPCAGKSSAAAARSGLGRHRRLHGSVGRVCGSAAAEDYDRVTWTQAQPHPPRRIHEHLALLMTASTGTGAQYPQHDVLPARCAGESCGVGVEVFYPQVGGVVGARGGGGGRCSGGRGAEGRGRVEEAQVGAAAGGNGGEDGGHLGLEQNLGRGVGTREHVE